MMKFYGIEISEDYSGRWFLDDPIDQSGKTLDPRIFNQGKRVDIEGPLRVPVKYTGDVVDFNFAAFDMLVTRKTLNEQIEKEVGDAIQRIPVHIEGYKTEFEILNIVGLVKCVDEEKSICKKWEEKDNRPDRVGDYRSIYMLHIHEEAAKEHKIFRIEGWIVEPIVNENVMNICKAYGATGVQFLPVN